MLASCEAEANIVSVSSLETIAYLAVDSGVLECFEDFEPNTMTIEHPPRYCGVSGSLVVLLVDEDTSNDA